MARLDLFSRDTGGVTPILLLHGFTAHSGAWNGVAATLARRYRVVQLDLPGHGRSPAPPPGYDFDDCGDDILAVLDRLGIERCNVLGYSMGGRIALALAARHPNRIDRLILESASPGIADSDLRAERARADRALAAEIESQPFERFVDRWMAQPLFQTQTALPAASRSAARRIRLDNRPDALAAALRALGTGTQPPCWENLSAMELPVLVINGELDAKFDGIAQAMHGLLPTSRREVIRGAGHTTHLEQPAAFAACVAAFLAAADSSRVAIGTGPADHA